MSNNDVQADGALARAERLLQQRLLPEAWSALCDAESAGADADRCAGGRWTVAMLNGELEAAWRESDAIRGRGAPDPNRFWLGDSIDGKRVIVRCLHGLGDSVQMLRYLPLLQERCHSVTVEVPSHLLPLTRSFAGMERAITWGEQAPAVPPAWDVQIEVMELPYVFRTSECDLPVAECYLAASAETIAHVAQRMGARERPRVGLVWSASEWDSTRCMPLKCVEGLLATREVEFWNLQGGKQHAVGMQSATIASIADAADFGDGLVTMAAVIANLDLVVTVDTLAAHLAGAMGKPAWILLQAQADWRWMHGRDDSPWYPSLRLWRQPVQNDWSTMTAQVADALIAWATAWRVHAA